MASAAAFFDILVTRAEAACSEAIRACPSDVDSELELAKADLIREALSLARTLITESKRIARGGSVNKTGIVQGKGSQVDSLCAEVSIRRQLAEER